MIIHDVEVGEPQDSVPYDGNVADYFLGVATAVVGPPSYIDASANVHPSASILSSYIGPLVDVYEGVTIRDSVVMTYSQVGHCSEVARSVLFPGVSLPRFNYVGASIIGARTRFGGCVACASRRIDDAEVRLASGEFTDVSKFGSIVGSDCHIGFASHLNPGALIGEHSIVHPYVDLRGRLPAKSHVVSTSTYRVLKRRSFNGSPFPHVD